MNSKPARFGKCTSISGPMFSNKTSEILKIISNAKRFGQTPLIIRHALDERFDDKNKIKTHDGYAIGVDVDHVHKNSLKPDILQNEMAKYDPIAIDEGQFFKSDELFDFVFAAGKMGKEIIVSGLLTDKDMKPYPYMQRI